MECYCGSGKPFEQCCGPLLEGKQEAATAEALMRSRYCAYLLGNHDYLVATWHPSTRPTLESLQQPGPRWLGLTIVATRAGRRGDGSGEVEFIARFRDGTRLGELHECSHFRFEAGRWFYLDGEVAPPPGGDEKVGRNAPCPCGSGKKFKRCCGK